MTTQRPSSSSSFSSSSPKWNFDVFISFRGEDTRKNFVDHLYQALCQKGIHTFKDDEKLPRGNEISPALLKAIEESRISIIVLSNDYASSTWCLDELVKILECKKTWGQKVFPIFYNVEPSHVRNQKESFAEAFARYEEDFDGNIEKVERWRAALKEVANISGRDSRKDADGYEAKLIQNIVQDILSELNRNHTFLYVAKNPVGINSHVEKINQLIGVGVLDVRIIGICGIGGIGKTTIANAVYNQIAKQFEGNSFLENVKEVWREHSALVDLQRKLLSEILGEANWNISNGDRGVSIIQQRLCHKRVLIVLDDVDHRDQLEKLVRKPDWFGLGSRIIITTRNEHLLHGVNGIYKHGVNGIYKVEKLNHDEALQLFSLNAFIKAHPTSDFLKLSNRVVNYADGLPLALIVLGSSLLGKTIVEWESALEKLKGTQHQEIFERLKISLDGLDVKEKDIFLDVACFFKGKNKDYVTKVLKSCGFCPEIGLRSLLERSLITISHNLLWMHDLLQEMGREIVRRESDKEPGKRSRLWFHEDVYDVLTENTGTEAVEGIILNSWSPEFVDEAFARMKKLRFLKVCYCSRDFEYFFQTKHSRPMGFPLVNNYRVLEDVNVHPPKDISYLSNKLRCLCWHGYPSKSMPSSFHPKDLVELDMCYSRLEQLWNAKINLKRLEFVNLSHSQYLTEAPDFSGFPSLKILILEGCTRLVVVHPSIEVLDRLVFLNLKDCKSLRSLSRSIKLESLETLVLSGCSNLEKFPEICGTMEHLSEVYLDGTGIKELPSSIEHLTGLVFLNLKDCKSLSSLSRSIKLESLETLVLSGCSNLEKFPEICGTMEHLSKVYLDGTGIKELPSSIEHLTGLVFLNLKDCKSLRSLSRSIRLESLRTLVLSGCSNLEKFPEICGTMEHLSKVYLDGTGIKELPSSIEHLTGLVLLSLKKCKNLASLPSSMFKLKSVRTLILSGCSKLGRLPENLGNMQNLVDLRLDGTAITQAPSSLISLRKLQNLSFRGCKGSPSKFLSRFLPRKTSCSIISILPSLSSLCSLTKLDLCDCNLSEGAIPDSIASMSSLQVLNLSKNNFASLPASFIRLSRLETLNLEHCTRLREFPPLPSRVSKIDTHGCRSLEKLPDLSLLGDVCLPLVRIFRFSNCEKLAYHEDALFFQRLFQFSLFVDKIYLKPDIFLGCGYSKILLTGSEIPKCFEHQRMGSSISFQMSPRQYSKCKALAFGIVFNIKGAAIDHLCFHRLMCKLSGAFSFEWCLDLDIPEGCHIESDHVWLFTESIKSSTEKPISHEYWYHFEFSFELKCVLKSGATPCQVKKCGVHIYYEQDEPAMIQYVSPQNLGVFDANFDKSTVVVEEQVTQPKRTCVYCNSDKEESSGSDDNYSDDEESSGCDDYYSDE